MKESLLIETKVEYYKIIITISLFIDYYITQLMFYTNNSKKEIIYFNNVSYLNI